MSGYDKIREGLATREAALERGVAALADPGAHAGELERIAGSLHRLKSGDYGRCLACGKPIPLPRLRLLRHARRCAACGARCSYSKPPEPPVV